MLRTEYTEILEQIPIEAEKLYRRQGQINKLNSKRTEIDEKMRSYFLDGINPRSRGYNEDDPNINSFYYNVHFRIPIYGTPDLIGFFFDVTGAETRMYFEPITYRVQDYKKHYRWQKTGDRDMYLIIDYAEEIMAKAKTRMQLTKYKLQYDLALLIDTLYSLAEMRGDNYLVRKGTPPVKNIPGVDRMTGNIKKVRGSSSKLNVGFKILRVDKE